YKLSKLGKTITIIGSVCAVGVFVINLIRLILTGTVTFSGVQDLFVSCIILIVAAVPEGLPTIVAVSLALNMIKLAKESALIKKMIATETAGAVSVICTDKTGTLTENKMKVLSVCLSDYCTAPEKVKKPYLIQNFLLNSTAIVSGNGKSLLRTGSGTELALVDAGLKSLKNQTLHDFRNQFQTVSVTPFSSEKKYMTTTVFDGKITRTLLKGAPEVVLSKCEITLEQRTKILKDISVHQNMARRVLCFAHSDGQGFVYDGYAVLCDGIRKDVKNAVKDCMRAGIKIKILTGDNKDTAYAVAKELGIATSPSQILSGGEVENLDDIALKKCLEKITVIARSTPIIKLRVVRALKELGEVVAVTGDGMNDAPAIKHADIGIAMGKSGSEITKESADLILLDDGFSTIVKAIAFGRSVFVNLQRFITFQLSVNLSALLFITVAALLNLKTPFNTLQLLWINVIMDGPPALTLGLERPSKDLLSEAPVKKEMGLIGVKTFIRVLLSGVFIAVIMILQYVNNVLGVGERERPATVFTLFITFQLFNAFNCRESGAKSILKGITKNKVMALTFLATFLVQIIIVTFLYAPFGITPLSLKSWVKILFTALSVVIASELIKFVYRKVTTFLPSRKKTLKRQIKISDKA
ncbi:MAG: cation-transporting P-type ATPase, partial [Clostridiales bacterium]|nr:cation-transporting P-type ATPase [Clostridiales bacterium]